MRRLLSARNLTDLWLVTPDWLFRWMKRRLEITDEVMHEWLCDSFGCRCDD